ncbi:phosphonate C-P lyase system protein PhnH [Celeribacter litoreus]|uniref:phosphonate C-P lyase system protein PhnH n=1 Tax=Celeribacter litoreus TaxID=2876714 RepID=UPI001CCFBC5E|nr:phosphonate C-P lyase system protein PhnH [Celeribacter litoreus]MCA0044780.1 phosphonate C-P lyase system protein PhnH [Celeribacter litoreus]
MDIQSLSGGFENAPVQSAHAFRTALNVLSRPGTIMELRGANAPAPVSEAAATLLLTLCDPETPLYLADTHDTKEVRDWIAFHIGAPLVGRAHAHFALGTWEALSPINTFPIGTPEYPDRSTTLIAELDELNEHGASLTGPGIKDRAHLGLPEIDAFQMNACLFPLGLDFYFTAGTRVAALPRSTKVEAD